jgi:hypothetical protein
MSVEPRFSPGDRVFSHYTMTWGTVRYVDHTQPAGVHGVTGDPLPPSTWYMVVMDDDSCHLLDDANGNWDLARIIPARVASLYGYMTDPTAL